MNIETIKEKINLSREHSKILNITHSDLDGCACSIILKNCFKNIDIKKVKYSDIDKVLINLNWKKYDKVILTDVSPSKKGYLKNIKNLILIDHHDTAKMYNDPEKLRFVIRDKCGSYLTKMFVESYFNMNLKHLNKLIMLVNDYDLWIHKYPKSKMLSDLYFKYWDKKFIERFKDGDINFTKEEQTFIKRRQLDFEDLYKNTVPWDLENINGCLISVNIFINEMCHRLLEEDNYDIVINRNPKNGTCSIRSNMENLHIGELLTKLKIGGGHKNAGGFWEKDPIEFKNKVLRIEKEIGNV